MLEVCSPPICYCPNPSVCERPLFGNGVFAAAQVTMRSVGWTRVQQDCVLIRGEFGHRDRCGGKPGEGTGRRRLLTDSLRGRQSRQHLDLGLSASRLGDYNHLLFKLPALCCFVWAPGHPAEGWGTAMLRQRTWKGQGHRVGEDKVTSQVGGLLSSARRVDSHGGGAPHPHGFLQHQPGKQRISSPRNPEQETG